MLSVRSMLLLVAVALSFLSLTSAQTNMIVNGNFEAGNLNGWSTPQGVDDAGIGATQRLRVHNYTRYSSQVGPTPWAYDGFSSLLIESSSLNQSIVQTVTVTGGTTYLLSFYVNFADGDNLQYLRVSAQFNGGTAINLLTPTGGEGAQQGFCSGSQKRQPPFYWSLFTFSITAPSSASSMILTFFGYNAEYGTQIDTISMYPASGNSQPSAPAGLSATPSGNLLLNGNFEAGTLQPFSETGGDNPFGISGSAYSGEGAYDFVGYAPASGIACPEGQYCLTFGAPLAPLPVAQTISVPSGTSATYTLSFYWYSLGGYNNTAGSGDAGSQLVAMAQWGSGAMSTVFSEYNTTAVTSSTQYNTVSVSLGVPPAGTTSLTIQLQGFFYATYYVVDYVQVTASGVSQSQSTPVYTCVGTGGGSPGGGGSNGAGQSFIAGALKTVAVLAAAVAMLML